MELTQLKYFLCTANCGQITRAADLLHVSQSAISTAISRLESELGVELFCKCGRNIKLTENGERFVAMITPAVAELDFARAEMLSANKLEPNTILLSVEVPDFASELERLYYRQSPDARFYQSTDTTEAALQKLRCNSVDFCLAFEPFSDPEIVSERILRDRVLAQMSNTHPPAGRESIWLAELADDLFVSFNREYSFRRWMEGMCFLAGFRPKVRFEVCGTQAIMALLLVRDAVTFIAESSWKCLARQSNSIGREDNPIIAIPFNDAFCERSCYICYHRNRILSPEARDFRDFAHRVHGAMEEYHDIDEVERRFFPAEGCDSGNASVKVKNALRI